MSIKFRWNISNENSSLFGNKNIDITIISNQKWTWKFVILIRKLLQSCFMLMELFYVYLWLHHLINWEILYVIKYFVFKYSFYLFYSFRTFFTSIIYFTNAVLQFKSLIIIYSTHRYYLTQSNVMVNVY